MYIRRQARDVPPTVYSTRDKTEAEQPKVEVPKPRLVPFDIPAMFGGKKQRYPTVRASIKGYRKMERKKNPPPSYTINGPFKVYA